MIKIGITFRHWYGHPGLANKILILADYNRPGYQIFLEWDFFDSLFNKRPWPSFNDPKKADVWISGTFEIHPISGWNKIGDLTRKFINESGISKDVLKKVDTIGEVPDLGIHIRGDDHYNKEHYLKKRHQILRMANTSKKIFLSTDDPELAQDILKGTTAEIVEIQNKNMNRKMDESAQIDALADMVALSRCSTILSLHESTFGRVAGYMGNKRVISVESMGKDFIYDILQGIAEPVIFDIGAKKGEETVKLLKTIPSAKIHSFEADPRAYEKLRQNISNYKCTVAHFSICDHDGEVPLYLSSGHTPDSDPNSSEWCLSSSIKKPVLHLEIYPWCKFEKTMPVPAITLDSYCQKNNIDHIDYIRINTQGAEREAIAGAQNMLKKTKYIGVSYNDSELYEGQPSLKEIINMLPEFKLLEDFSTTALFVKNT